MELAPRGRYVSSRWMAGVRLWLFSRGALVLGVLLLLLSARTDFPAVVVRAVHPFLSPGPVVEVAAPFRDDLRRSVAVAAGPAGGLRLLAAPDGEAEPRGEVAAGERLEVLEGPVAAVGGVWYQVRTGADAEPSWVRAAYLSADGSTDGERPPALFAPGPLPYTPVRPLPPDSVGDDRFGLVEAFRLAGDDQAARLGARYERLVFWWSALQQAPGSALNPHYLPPALLDRERERGLRLVGAILSTPAWAAANPAAGPRSVPRNLALPWDDPANDWGRFVERLARDYAGRVDDWIIWNEPDIQPGDPNSAYHTWAGTVEDYYALLRVAYLSAKRGNPAARIHLAGLTYWVDERRGQPQFFERLLDLMAADETAAAHDYYFDVVTLHLYTDPRSLYRVPRLYRELMRARGMDKPSWIDETNVIPWDDRTNAGTGYDVPTDMRCSLIDQAAYILQAFALGLAGGAERLAVYKATDSVGAAYNGEVDAVERAALVREDGSLRPAYVAYQTAVRYLAGAESAQYFPGRDVEAVVAQRRDGDRVTVLWNPGGRPTVARLKASGAGAELVDAAGRRYRLVQDQSGEYAIALPPATCQTDPDHPTRYLLGGETYLVVESDVSPDAALQAPLAEG